MDLLFEKSHVGRRCSILASCDVPSVEIPSSYARKNPPRLPQMSENDISRHYSALARRSFGVNDGFYPLGSCTMKYNPKIAEVLAGLPGFTDIHPLQPNHTVEGAHEVLDTARSYLCEITGMEDMTFQPSAGSQGEFTGLLLIKAYHKRQGDDGRTKIIVPDSAHGTNPASAAMAGFSVVNLPSAPDGCVDVEALKAAVGPDTAGLMLTNPNTLGIFDPNILEITRIVHEAGGLNYYDGANLNAVVGMARPGDMGFDVIHLNLHKTFATPHGGGGPGSGAVGCKALLSSFLPETGRESIGRIHAFHGNFGVVVKALSYIMTLGREGIPEVARGAVLNANYMKKKLAGTYTMSHPGLCMHEFVMTLQPEKEKYGVTAMDIAKSLQDRGIHPPTMYFPLIVHEALMVEPVETESLETLDKAIADLLEIHELAKTDPDALHAAPTSTSVGRPDDVQAARHPVVRYAFGE
ncbi:aminomethyl-transferring glycine dehydrogenase subunit GcvPB [Sphaerochaeta coccoides]|uniref:glycine dehydrogenase (aminomethyl-transferring) n=1 Tax=Parasphaerochaeta coccoides (strain ATCC BAA-1237 / DSM 17374 / SPN1) TaxID=760011 RepID=F4GLN1_PARC1|nr:glycine dehydrogenase (decarboxylating) beta subunit [Parasphaerochaeta coccoides DSM 17374]